MKVNEELNALKTFGLDPIPFLVVPRILAGVFVTPLLTFYSILMGVIGGVIVMLGLGFALPLILHQLASSVHLNDLGAGILQERGLWRYRVGGGLLARFAHSAGTQCRRSFDHSGRRNQPAAHHRGRCLLFRNFFPSQMMNAPADIAISVKDLTVGYGDTVILQNVNFQVRRGEVFVILGASGSGKSTLLKAMIGLNPPLSGEVWIEGRNLVAAQGEREAGAVAQNWRDVSEWRAVRLHIRSSRTCGCRWMSSPTCRIR